jgi:hypothetical protein
VRDGDVTERPTGPAAAPVTRRAAFVVRTRHLIDAIRDGDEATVEAAVLDLSQRRRIFAPLAFVVSAFVMLFEGVKLVVSNWRLTLVQILPAMWIWVAHFDLKAHVLRDARFQTVYGWRLGLGVLVIAVITAASFFLNAVFGLAVAKPGRPEIRPAFSEARRRAPFVIGAGVVVGVLLGLAALYVHRWGPPWFSVSMSIMIVVLMVAYVWIPARLIGLKKPTRSKADSLKTSAVGGALGVIVCTPPHLIARIGILMLGSKVLFIPGIVFITIGATVQVGATGAVKAVKMSAKLVAGMEPTTTSGP